jgi:phage-related protein (TIGR01555 family)
MSAFYEREIQLDDEELTAMYSSDDMAGRIVDTRPEEMFRAGYRVISDKSQEMTDKAKALKVNDNFLDGYRWGRLRGGALLIIGAQDGKKAAQPLDEESVKDITFLTVVDRRSAEVFSYYNDPLKPNFGDPELYSITPQTLAGRDGGPTGKPILVHESRCIRFEGAPTDRMERVRLKGWTYSVLQRPYNVLRQFGQAYGATAILLSDASQAVWKLAGLMDQIANDQETLNRRMQVMELQRSAARAILLDADENEDFDRKPTQFGGIPELLDRWQQRLAAAAGMPVTILMGRSPAGMNATGDADFRSFYGSIESEQKNGLTPKLLKIYRMIARLVSADPEKVEIEHNSLISLTDDERAALEKTCAERDAILVTNQVFTPEEVKIARFGQGVPFSLTLKAEKDWIDAARESLKTEDRLSQAWVQPDPAMNPGNSNAAPNDPNAPAKPAPQAPADKQPPGNSSQ